MPDAPKLLFDENLPPRLARDLAQVFPGSKHVRDLGLQAADDEAVWRRAATEGFVIVTRDDDFRQRSFLRGHPPKVVWLRIGNARTGEVAELLRSRHEEVAMFIADRELALLVLDKSPKRSKPGARPDHGP